METLEELYCGVVLPHHAYLSKARNSRHRTQYYVTAVLYELKGTLAYGTMYYAVTHCRRCGEKVPVDVHSQGVLRLRSIANPEWP